MHLVALGEPADQAHGGVAERVVVRLAPDVVEDAAIGAADRLDDDVGLPVRAPQFPAHPLEAAVSAVEPRPDLLDPARRRQDVDLVGEERIQPSVPLALRQRPQRLGDHRRRQAQHGDECVGHPCPPSCSWRDRTAPRLTPPAFRPIFGGPARRGGSGDCTRRGR